MITLRNISKSFGDQAVLKDISTTFNAGACNLIIGKSGSGKSVLMKCMVGLVNVDAGHVYYQDKDFLYLQKSEQVKLRQEIGMLFQGSALFDSLNVVENVMFPLQMYSKMSKAEMKDRVEFCLHRVNLENAHKKYPSEISGGMKKRVALARAIVLNPKYLFCDEPNSGLDPKTSIVIDQLIKEITYEFSMTTIINTHDMNSVMEMGDRVVFLHLGEKNWEGSNKEILNSNNEILEDFIFASKFLKELKKTNFA